MTQQEQTEGMLRDCEKKFLNALQECPLAVTLTSTVDNRYIEVNNTFERITGWNRNEIIGRTPFDIDIFVNPSDRTEAVKRLLAGATVRNFEVRARMKNRELRVGLAYAALIEINGETCVLALIADVTDVKRPFGHGTHVDPSARGGACLGCPRSSRVRRPPYVSFDRPRSRPAKFFRIRI
jgi:PAS domain S-box-containing protein